MVASSPRSNSRPAPVLPTLILLVRHGTTPTTGKVLPGRARGLHLSEHGRAQAEAVAARIAEWAPPGEPQASPEAPPPSGRRGRAKPAPPSGPRIAAVYASPLERARETAAPIGKALSCKVTIARGLLECDFGEWTGKELKDLGKLPEWTTVQRFPSGFRFPGGESFTGMQARMVETLSAICRRHRGQAVVCVSHADPIKAAVADAMGTPLDLFQRIVISPCSVSAISVGATGPTVLAVNSTGTLKELRPS